MRHQNLIKAVLLLVFCSSYVAGLTQNQIALPKKEAPKEIKWDRGEQEYFSKLWNTEVVTNVSAPSMAVFKPNPALANGTSVVICPGGGLYALSINSEGRDVAKWLAARGVTAFVLKYRLVPTGEDGTREISEEGSKGFGLIYKKVEPVLPLSVSDGLAAIEYVRKNAATLGVDPERIGLMGFSAGGAVTMGATYSCEAGNCPDFIAPVYAWMDVVTPSEPPTDAPPIFIVCATDDPLNLAPASVKLYSDWIKAGKSAEIHMYAKGGHGFGMRKQNLPSDQWIDRFGEWLEVQGLMSKGDKVNK